MLKALELVGFKSFADRTRFEFPDGITVVVGPNGSGKSNVVDAVKWVLGAQSAKALRGAEMTDVIFKGSAEGGRKPANSAEVVLVLDNRTRILPLDADEIEVGRRVFRSGEGEYAINGRPSRLKDVRDLFRGTGVGVDAYSLIEQGKVDRLLQSSPKDRRAIFEEAAGISRFKAKKAEAERRLGRVDQNMLRLRDIVDEVGKRLGTLKSQASKAQRYRELNDQLIVKRTQLGMIDLRGLRSQSSQLAEQIELAEGHRTNYSEQVASAEAALNQINQQLGAMQQELEHYNVRMLEVQTAHVQATSELGAARQRHSEWLTEQSNLQDRIETLQRRVSMSEEDIADRNRELESLDRERLAAEHTIVGLDADCREQEQSLAQMRRELETERKNQSQLREQIAQARYDASLHASQLEQLAEALLRGQSDIDQLQKQVDTLRQELKRSENEISDAQSLSIAATENKRTAKERHNAVCDRERVAQQSILELQARIQGVRERLLVLAQLEEQFASAGRGAQQLLRAAQSLAAQHPSLEHGLRTIRGLVADLITTDLHLAPLVDVALGTHADAIVLSDGQVIDWINEGRLQVDGRVTLLRLDRLPTRRSGEKIQLDGLRGVVGRADRLVRFDGMHEPLVRALLGTTWFVESLSTALDLSHFRGAGLRFVTAECQLIDSDGSITIGSLQTGLGLVSRRSEMQAANEQIEHLEQLLSNARQQLAEIETELRTTSDDVRLAEQQVVDATRQLAASEQRWSSFRDRIDADQSHFEALRGDLSDKASLRQAMEQSYAQFNLQSADLETQQMQLAVRAESLDQKIIHCDALLKTRNAELVARRVELARLEQRCDGLRTTLEQLLQDANERAMHVQQAQQSLSSLAEKIHSADDWILELKERIALSDAELVQLQQDRTGIVSRIDAQQVAVMEASKNRDHARRQLDKLQDRLAACNEEHDRLVQECDDVLARYSHEYQIDLKSEHALKVAGLGLIPSFSEDSEVLQDLETRSETLLASADDRSSAESLESAIDRMDRSAIETQLIHLRQEIAAAGSVNMEALDELDALQARYDQLSGHERDLLDAKSSLIKTMQKIDIDSQTLFLDTLEAIRANFQTLYRKSFGGGSADIVLENPDDPDSGIEIMATPPGKTTFSNSLLSGGEKALTAVALIMAFFQYRPSPFCILDEVDAPFDEANIGRFVTVLNEFLDTTKFIVVTHSKKTMTVANTIYGITMQESGVSRQVAVKFEEVNDQGEVIRRDHRRAA
jgi:chromosome segregation protein